MVVYRFHAELWSLASFFQICCIKTLFIWVSLESRLVALMMFCTLEKGDDKRYDCLSQKATQSMSIKRIFVFSVCTFVLRLILHRFISFHYKAPSKCFWGIHFDNSAIQSSLLDAITKVTCCINPHPKNPF